jgi:hypothetical protein
MNDNMTFRDVEKLSAYLDGQLSRADAARLESRLASDPGLRAVMDDLRRTRAVLGPPGESVADELRELTLAATAAVSQADFLLIFGGGSQGRIVDFAGLIQPNTSFYLRQAEDWRPAILAALEKYHPEYVVMVGEYTDWQMQAGYQRCSTLQTYPISTTAVFLYHCPTR